MTAITEETVGQGGDGQEQPLSRTLDWAISLFLVLSGTVFAAGGFLIFRFADLGRITSWVAEGRITSTDLSDPELINAVYAFIWGGGISVTVTGALLAAAGVVFFGFQTRARRRYDVTGIASPSVVGNAIIGAMVTIVASFVPFSPVLGGAVSGYLQRGSTDSPVRVGGTAGLFATLPVVIVFVTITWSLLGSDTGLTTIVVASLAISLVVSIAYMIGLSALGGYLGAELATRDAPHPEGPD
jgi:hypothetical protein